MPFALKASAEHIKSFHENFWVSAVHLLTTNRRQRPAVNVGRIFSPEPMSAVLPRFFDKVANNGKGEQISARAPGLPDVNAIGGDKIQRITQALFTPYEISLLSESGPCQVISEVASLTAPRSIRSA